MVFSSSIFLFIFFPLILICYFNPFFRGRKFRNAVLLIFSLAFYAYGEPLFVLLMIFSICVNYVFGILIDKNAVKNRQKLKILWLILAIIWNIGILFIFKYLSFVSKIIAEHFAFIATNSVSIALPIGISFFTFQILSYIIDLYNQKCGVQKNIFNLALYISLFPQLIAGPIVRYSTVENEIENRTENSQDVTNGFVRFVFGLGKKCLLANYMAVIADVVFNGFDAGIIPSALDAWLGAIAYSLQIYFDFSGYSDMAIGLGLIFGFHFNENFNYPYMARSITDFWRRWHISLSSWFRDYVYIPLGGNRKGIPRQFFNMFVVWALTGIWHGAAFTFWVWGILYFVLLSVEKFFSLDKIGKKVPAFFYRLFTLFCVMCAWIIFRSPSLGFAFNYWTYLFGASPVKAGGNIFEIFANNYYLQNGGILLLASVIACFPIFPLLKSKYSALLDNLQQKKAKFCKMLSFLTQIAICLWFAFVFVFSVLSCIKSTYNPFIYFNF